MLYIDGKWCEASSGRLFDVTNPATGEVIGQSADGGAADARAAIEAAARSFDPERGIAFDRFASARIRGALLDELRSRDWASRSVRARARSVSAAVDDLTAAACE